MATAKALISRFSCVVAFLPAVGAAGPAFSYDASWYKARGWSGEYPDGFTMAADVTLNIRGSPDLDTRSGPSRADWNLSPSPRLRHTSLKRVLRLKFRASRTAVTRPSNSRGATDGRISPISPRGTFSLSSVTRCMSLVRTCTTNRLRSRRQSRATAARMMSG